MVSNFSSWNNKTDFEENAKMSKVILYTTPTCAWCVKVKEFLKSKKVKYKEVDVTKDTVKAQEMIEKSGQMGVPVVEVDNNIIIGYNEAQLKKLLKIN